MNKQTLIWLGLIAAVLVVFYVRNYFQDRSLPSVTAKEIQQRLANKDSSMFFLDVRTQGEFNGPLGHIKGAKLIPVQELAGRVKELNKHKNKEVIVYCRSGNRSRRATRVLLQNGFDAKNMLGGMRAWNSQKP